MKEKGHQGEHGMFVCTNETYLFYLNRKDKNLNTYSLNLFAKFLIIYLCHIHRVVFESYLDLPFGF